LKLPAIRQSRRRELECSVLGAACFPSFDRNQGLIEIQGRETIERAVGSFVSIMLAADARHDRQNRLAPAAVAKKVSGARKNQNTTIRTKMRG
jgi:hypothetical protein